MQIPLEDTTGHLPGWPKRSIYVGKDAEQLEVSYTAGGSELEMPL